MSDSYTQLYLHLVWSTWDRSPLITPEMEPSLYKALIARGKQLHCELLAVGGDIDHIHILLRMPTTRCIAEIVRELKGASSYVAHQEGTELRWQHGYGAFTLRKSDLAVIERYIREQKEHHQKKTLIPEWEKTFTPKTKAQETT